LKLPCAVSGLFAIIVALCPPSSDAQQRAAVKTAPGVFAVGFTNVSDDSTRLVFTTSEPMSTRVDLFESGKLVLTRSQTSLEEIHAVPLDGLAKDHTYRVSISATDAAGVTANAEATLHARLRQPSNHAWLGYTIFSSTIFSENPEGLDLLERSGARMARIEPSWDSVYPRRGQLNKEFLDKMVKRVAELKARGIEPLVILDYCVSWAKPYTDKTMTWRNRNFGPPDELADWEVYVRTIVTALHGSARYYEVWNEPDAGYLATGSYVERPDLPPPIGRAPFKDNTEYWIGDRYAPMLAVVRKVTDELEPNAIVMNGGWNRDYTGARGDILLKRDGGSSMDLYAYHVYTHSPTSFSRWYKEVDGGFRKNIDRIMSSNHLSMPLAVTEWGTAAWNDPPPGKGFATYSDSQLFYLKSTFYFLSMERFELLSQFAMGLGSTARDKDPTFFMLANQDPGHPLVVTPTYATFQWLARTFGSKAYRALPVHFTENPQAKAYAIQMKDSGDIYLAAWQDGTVDDIGAVSPLPAKTVSVSLDVFAKGSYRAITLDATGQLKATKLVQANGRLALDLPLPEASSMAESGVYLTRIAGISR
jgi:hypothetical protein